MNRKQACGLVLMVVLAAALCACLFRPARRSTPLRDAVASFNQRSAAHPTGATQPPLTEAEVIAAIHGWIPPNAPKEKVEESIYQVFQSIADTRSLPEGANLSFTTGHGDRPVWWIDLSIKTGKDIGYTFRIRATDLGSKSSGR